MLSLVRIPDLDDSRPEIRTQSIGQLSSINSDGNYLDAEEDYRMHFYRKSVSIAF